MAEEYEDIMNMTDEEAAEVLEKVHVMINVGRMNGKTRLQMSYNVALKKAIIALKSTAYCMAAAAGAGYEAGKEENRPKGYWMNTEDDSPFHFKYTICSHCKKEAIIDDWDCYVKSDFCPNCGADMRGKENEGGTN